MFALRKPASLAIAVTWFIALFGSRTVAAQQAPESPERRPQLAAHGTAESFWIVETRPVAGGEPEDFVSFVLARPMQGQWQLWSRFPARPVALTNLGDELLLALEEGTWRRFSAERSTFGTSLPDGSRILAIAGEGNALWAVGAGHRPLVVPSATAAATTRAATMTGAALPKVATRPASRPAMATRAAATTSQPAMSTRPAAAATKLTIAMTRPAATRPTRLQLFSLSGTTWVWHATLPETAQAVTDPRRLALLLQDGRALLAYADGAGAARVARLDGAHGQWFGGPPIQTTFPVRELKLMRLRDRLALWLSDGIAPGELRFEQVSVTGDGAVAWGPPVAMTLPADVPVTARTVAAAGDQVRLVILSGMTRLEQRYDPDGRTRPPEKLPIALGEAQQVDWMNLAMMVTLTIVMLATLGRRQVAVVSLGGIEVALAPPGSRLLAGLIDLIPTIASIAVVAFLQRRRDPMVELGDRRHLWVWFSGLALYVLHTMVSELIWGRSLGKMFVGIRVIGINGQPAPARAIVLRNLMRPADLALVMMIFFSPLRQRMGDIMAGTLVILNRIPRDGPAIPRPERSQDDDEQDDGGS